MPPLIGALIIATAVLSIGGLLGAQFGSALVTYGLLVPHALFEGQVWRLVTWVFFYLDSPLNLIFGCLMLYWFGRDLAGAWGQRWFAGAFFGGAAVTGAVLALVGRFLWPAALYAPFTGGMAMTGGMVIMWALANPDRIIRFQFLIPMRGITLLWVEFGMTVLYGVYYGPLSVLHVVVAQLLALGYMFRGTLFGRLRALLPKRRPRGRPPTSFQVWDEKKQQFRPPKWMN